MRAVISFRELPKRFPHGDSYGVRFKLPFVMMTTLPLYGNGVQRFGAGAEDIGSAGAFSGTDGGVIGTLLTNPAAMVMLGDGAWAISGQALLGDGSFRRGGESFHLEDTFGVIPEVGVAWKIPQKPIWIGASLSARSAIAAGLGLWRCPRGHWRSCLPQFGGGEPIYRNSGQSRFGLADQLAVDDRGERGLGSQRGRFRCSFYFSNKLDPCGCQGRPRLGDDWLVGGL